MDVVYVVGPRDRNDELCWSLRSLVNLPHDRVWIAGHKPNRINDAVGHIPVEQSAAARWENSTANMRGACQHPDVSDPFIYFNDDFFVMRPVDHIPVMHLGPISEVVARWGGSSYARGARSTMDLLVSLGYEEPVSYEVHAPMVVDKAGMLAALDLGAGIVPLHKRSLYGNLAGLGGSRVTDVKISNKGTWPDGAHFLSTNDMSFAYGQVGHHIRSLFPTPSPYEVHRMTENTDIEALRAEAESLGVKVRSDAKADTIRRRIDEHLTAAEDQGGPEEPVEPADVPAPVDPEPKPQPVGRRRSWVNAAGKRKTTTVGSGLDRWYESAEGWEPA